MTDRTVGVWCRRENGRARLCGVAGVLLAMAMFLPAMAQAGLTMAINAGDGELFGDIRRFDFTATALPPLAAPFTGGTAYTSSVDFDPVTGHIYGLYGNGGFPGSKVRIWSAGGSVVSDLAFDASETGTGPPLGMGADIAVHNGVMAIIERDGEVFGPIHRFDSAGNALAQLDAPFTGGTAYTSSIDFDPVTGNLYALYGNGGFPGTKVRIWDPAGTVLADLDFDASETGTGPPLGAGADIAVYGGVMAIIYADGEVFGPIHRFDAAGNALAQFAAPFTGGTAYTSSIDYDPVTGDLYALYGNGGFPGTKVRAWDENGTVLADLDFDATETGTGPPLGAGADIAIVNFAMDVPEPATGLLFGVGLAALPVVRRRRRRRAD